MSDVIIDISEGVMELRLNRPDKLNAVTPAMTAAIGTAIDLAAHDDAVRCLLITGAGRGFCAGRDLGSAEAGEDARAILASQMNPVILAIHDLPKPTIAAVNGAAMGFGLGLALACDLVHAAESAKFSAPFARLGAALDCGGHYFLHRRIGNSRALEMIYTAATVNGKEALQIGLADRCWPDAELATEARRVAQVIADGPLYALMRQKALLRNAATLPLSDVLAREANLQGELAGTDDYREGISAFGEKRRPVFRGQR